MNASWIFYFNIRRWEGVFGVGVAFDPLDDGASVNAELVGDRWDSPMPCWHITPAPSLLCATSAGSSWAPALCRVAESRPRYCDRVERRLGKGD